MTTVDDIADDQAVRIVRDFLASARANGRKVALSLKPEFEPVYGGSGEVADYRYLKTELTLRVAAHDGGRERAAAVQATEGR